MSQKALALNSWRLQFFLSLSEEKSFFQKKQPFLTRAGVNAEELFGLAQKSNFFLQLKCQKQPNAIVRSFLY